MANPSPDKGNAELLDGDGENLAVRAFLLYYGGGNAACPIISMRAHLARSGFDGCWPAWAAAPNSSTLTKAGVQLWLRHLFSLERATPPSPSAAPEVQSWQDRMSVHYAQDGRVQMFGTEHFKDQEIAELRRALASRPAEVDDEGLPPLPLGTPVMHIAEETGSGSTAYTAEQYRQGQRDAVAADRARRAAAGGGQ